MILTSSRIETPLGEMLAIAGDKALYLLEFIDKKGLQQEISRLEREAKGLVVAGRSTLLDLIAIELERYFLVKTATFTTVFLPFGSEFQQRVWKALQQIPYGETRSYREMAAMVGKPTAFRAVARAIASNPLAILVPCHRVIYQDGRIGGYSGGIYRKEALLNHERE